MKLINKLWWKLIPGETVKVKWPIGWVVLKEDSVGGMTQVESADPNDHYRPWMEKHVGRQGWDWDWCLKDNDIADNHLTIKIRQGKVQYLTHIGLMWS